MLMWKTNKFSMLASRIFIRRWFSFVNFIRWSCENRFVSVFKSITDNLDYINLNLTYDYNKRSHEMVQNERSKYSVSHFILHILIYNLQVLNPLSRGRRRKRLTLQTLCRELLYFLIIYHEFHYTEQKCILFTWKKNWSRFFLNSYFYSVILFIFQIRMGQNAVFM